MPFTYHFSPKSMTSQKYDECIAQLTAAGAGAPVGRLHHVAYGSPSALQVFDIWDSNESFEEFGKTLGPILQGLGVDPGEPEVAEVHNIIAGS
jgi:hypothetical protein